MAIEPEYKELFSEYVTLFASASVDAYGKRSWGASSTASAHLVNDRKLTRMADGREIVETGKAYLWGTPTVDVDSRLVLMDGSEPIIIGVDVVYADDGPHHTVVRFGE